MIFSAARLHGHASSRRRPYTGGGRVDNARTWPGLDRLLPRHVIEWAAVWRFALEGDLDKSRKARFVVFNASSFSIRLRLFQNWRQLRRDHRCEPGGREGISCPAVDGPIAQRAEGGRPAHRLDERRSRRLAAQAFLWPSIPAICRSITPPPPFLYGTGMSSRLA